MGEGKKKMEGMMERRRRETLGGMGRMTRVTDGVSVVSSTHS